MGGVCAWGSLLTKCFHLFVSHLWEVSVNGRCPLMADVSLNGRCLLIRVSIYLKCPVYGRCPPIVYVRLRGVLQEVFAFVSCPLMGAGRGGGGGG